MNTPFEQVSNAKQHPTPEFDDLTHDIPEELAPRIKAAALRAGLSYESFTQQLLSCAFAHVTFWQQSDVERLFWLADRLGLDPLERDLIALEQKEAFPPTLAFMITLDGWVKLLHRHPRFRGLSFEDGPSDEHGLPIWVACSVFWEGFACPWVVREWACEHRSLHESWLDHPRRMLRHKALTQCARLALGVGGGFWANRDKSATTPTTKNTGDNRTDTESSGQGWRRHDRASSSAQSRSYSDSSSLVQTLLASSENGGRMRP